MTSRRPPRRRHRGHAVVSVVPATMSAARRRGTTVHGIVGDVVDTPEGMNISAPDNAHYGEPPLGPPTHAGGGAQRHERAVLRAVLPQSGGRSRRGASLEADGGPQYDPGR
jgi:hypothetical protein